MSLAMSVDNGAPVTKDTIQKQPNVLQEELKKIDVEVTTAEENYNSLAWAFQSIQSDNAIIRKTFDVQLAELAESASLKSKITDII